MDLVQDRVVIVVLVMAIPLDILPSYVCICRLLGDVFYDSDYILLNGN
jgi:hypothetical protein